MKKFTPLLILLFISVIISCEKKNEDEPPVPVFEIVPATGPFTEVFTFNAHDTYDNSEPNENLLVRWDWENDGVFDTEYSLDRSFEHQYAYPDSYNVMMEVMNSKGWTSTEVKPLIVYADSVPPVASFVVNPDSASVITIFYFNASGSSDQYTPLDELEFRWDWQSDGVWDRPFDADTSIHYKYDNPGIYRVLMEVRNNFGITDTTSRIVHVYEL
jgi:PKD repeat protein